MTPHQQSQSMEKKCSSPLMLMALKNIGNDNFQPHQSHRLKVYLMLWAMENIHKPAYDRYKFLDYIAPKLKGIDSTRTLTQEYLLKLAPLVYPFTPFNTYPESYFAVLCSLLRTRLNKFEIDLFYATLERCSHELANKVN